MATLRFKRSEVIDIIYATSCKQRNCPDCIFAKSPTKGTCQLRRITTLMKYHGISRIESYLTLDYYTRTSIRNLIKTLENHG